MAAMALVPIGCVAIGGAVGSLLRYAVMQLTMHLYPQSFPIGTMVVNILGSFVMGVLMARFSNAEATHAQLLLVTGMLGGFTTFSAFSWDALQLVQRGQWSGALVYIGGSIILSFAAVAGGFSLGR